VRRKPTFPRHPDERRIVVDSMEKPDLAVMARPDSMALSLGDNVPDVLSSPAAPDRRDPWNRPVGPPPT